MRIEHARPVFPVSPKLDETLNSEKCHGYRVVGIIFEQTGMRYSESVLYLDIEPFNTLEDYTMRVFNVEDVSFLYIKAPPRNKILYSLPSRGNLLSAYGLPG